MRYTAGTQPPGLRFPTADIVGSHFVLSGVTTENSNYVLSIHSLDLSTMMWTPLSLGSIFHTGSWHTSVFWPGENKLLVLGDKHASMTEDYSQRAMGLDHVVVIELEAFGIYQPPEQRADIPMQELGLAALKGQHFTDFELVCDDGRSISCSRKLLEERWPWLKERIQMIRRAGNNSIDTRLSPQSFRLMEPYTTTLALLQYFYAQALLTALQHTPSIRHQLLVVAVTYGIPHLAKLVIHAMHVDLSPTNAQGISRVAHLCGAGGLERRALRMASVCSLPFSDLLISDGSLRATYLHPLPHIGRPRHKKVLHRHLSITAFNRRRSRTWNESG